MDINEDQRAWLINFLTRKEDWKREEVQMKSYPRATEKNNYKIQEKENLCKV